MSNSIKAKAAATGVGSRWTKAEDDALMRGIHREGDDFDLISNKYLYSKRTADQCRMRWEGVLAAGLVKGAWTPDEDRKLLECINSGMVKWSEIAAHLPGRIGKQCRERYQNHLAPDLNRGPFTAEEDEKLMQAVREIGTRWIEIAKRLPGRSENACKNRYNSTLRRQANALKAMIRKQSPVPDISKVAVSLAKKSLGVAAGPGSSSIALEDIAINGSGSVVEDLVTPPAKAGRPRNRSSRSYKSAVTISPRVVHPSTRTTRRSMAEAALPIPPPVARATSADAPMVLVGGEEDEADRLSDADLQSSLQAGDHFASEPVEGLDIGSTPFTERRGRSLLTPFVNAQDRQQEALGGERLRQSIFSPDGTPLELSMLSANTNAHAHLLDIEGDISRDSFASGSRPGSRAKRSRAAMEAESHMLATFSNPGVHRLAANSPVVVARETRSHPHTAPRRLGPAERTPYAPSHEVNTRNGTWTAPRRSHTDRVAPHLQPDISSAAKRPRFTAPPSSMSRPHLQSVDNSLETDTSYPDSSPRAALHGQFSSFEALQTPALAPVAAEALTALKGQLDDLSPLASPLYRDQEMRTRPFVLDASMSAMKPSVTLEAQSSTGSGAVPSELDSAEALLTMFAGKAAQSSSTATDSPLSMNQST